MIILLGALAHHWPQVADVSRILRPLLGWSSLVAFAYAALEL